MDNSGARGEKKGIIKMPGDPKEYDATIYFLYGESEGWTARDTSLKDAESQIRYWLGKSPGMREMDEILVVPNDGSKSWLWVRDKIRDEQFEREQQREEAREREQYERLKAKYGPSVEHAEGRA